MEGGRESKYDAWVLFSYRRTAPSTAIATNRIRCAVWRSIHNKPYTQYYINHGHKFHQNNELNEWALFDGFQCFQFSLYVLKRWAERDAYIQTYTGAYPVDR